MSIRRVIKLFAVNYLDGLRLQLARQEALLQLTLLGALSGLGAGLVIVGFRLIINAAPPHLLGADHPQRFEYLDTWLRVLLPILGGLLVGLLLQRLDKADRQVGVVHVMERLAYNEAHLPLKNAGVQFMTAVICIITGQSVGREGPSIHIGAAAGSWMGQRLRLPNNSIRVLVGCGSAGAIAAAFNTPLAGVIFAMEVVMAEYSIASFIPIILAAVSATTLSRWVFGPGPIIQLPVFDMGSLGDMLHIVLIGVVIGALASVFVRLLIAVAKYCSALPIWLRLTLAGACTGVLAVWVPEVMGIGYDTVGDVLMGKLALGFLLVLLVCKVLVTALGLGLGLPGGVIGPTLVIGVLAGDALGIIGNNLSLGETEHAFYALLGMGAMMGATLNAPLAALTTLLELTSNLHVILPGMLAIVAASITCQQLFKTPSVFAKLMQMRGLDYTVHPLAQFLSRLGVVHAMDRQVKPATRRLTREQLDTLLASPSTWLWVSDSEVGSQIFFTADIIRAVATEVLPEELDLAELPVQRLQVARLSSQATLWGALQEMERESVDALYVVSAYSEHLLGVITRQDIERSYRRPLV